MTRLFPTSTFLSLLEPAILLYYAIKTYVCVALSDLASHSRIQPDLRGRSFGQFWTFLSGSPDPTPDDQLVGSATLVPPLLAQAIGTVLDIGPGSGSLIPKFSPAVNGIIKIYGAEPSVELHGLLRKNAAATPLASKYVPLVADATFERVAGELVNLGVIKEREQAKGYFDTIVCVRVLCGVSDLHKSIADIHALLKPGGKLLICEHTANPWRTAKGSLIARGLQSLYMSLGWSYFLGDCQLTRDTEEVLRTQDWESVELERHFGKVVLTYISGVLVKRK